MADRTASFDGRFYAVQTVNKARFITVTVYESATDKSAGGFVPQ